MTQHNRILPYLWYPLLTGVAIALYVWIVSRGAPVALAAYAPVALSAFAILLLQERFPERLSWRAKWADIRSDAMFLVMVQVLLPRMLAWLAVLILANWAHEYAPSGWWPQDWPVVAQTLVMVLVVDLMRYWLHRACHRWEWLWRLHEVHHAPDILYALNVGRFHPLEKTLHFCLDTVPFLVLGVAPEVVAGYFLLYSVNGFFQHCNVKLRYGWLNYVVGSAETHRWHHAKDPQTASCNFGNTTMVWDVLFGTWYLPKDKVVGEVGIPDHDYPKDFWSQLVTPFRRRSNTPSGRSWKLQLVDTLLTLRLRLARMIEGWRIASAARDPMRVQNRLLARLLRDNRNTALGRLHGFGSIFGYRQFTERVPVRDYEALRPFIEAQIDRGEKALTGAAPVCYVRTSGTTGRPKDIPLTRPHLRALRRAQRTAVAFQHRLCPQAFAGAILAIISPASEGVLSNGKSYGAASGVVADSTPQLLRDKFVLPPEVLTIANSEVKYLLILRLALARPDLTYLGTANASTLLALMRLYREHAGALLEDLRTGTFFLSHRLPAEIWPAIRSRMAACPERAAELSRIVPGPHAALIADLWPRLRLVVAWTRASAGIAVKALRRELSGETRILELGYLASEFRGTITLGRNAGTGWPTLDTHFFEFVERAKWDNGTPEYLTLDRIRKGAHYYVIVTTPSGLCRYFMNDLVRVTGFLHRTPLLEFVQKGKGVTSITGEKLYEAQVLTAVHTALDEASLAPRFVMMLADEQLAGYRLYVEAEPGQPVPATSIAQLVDGKLMDLNVEYRSKRESGRLAPLRAAWLEIGTADRYKQFCVQGGQREGQFKATALSYSREFPFDLHAFVKGD